MTTTSALRPVGMLEKLYTARQVLDIYNSVIVTATYAVPSGLGDASLCSILYTAIAELIKRHSSLCCYIEGQDSSNPIFKRLDTIEIKEIIQITCLSKQESLAHKLQELHEQRWSTEQKPLWKLAVMKGPQIASDTSPKLHIAFIYHHAIGDGLSGIALHKSLLHELNIKRTKQELQNSIKTIDIPLLSAWLNLSKSSPLYHLARCFS